MLEDFKRKGSIKPFNFAQDCVNINNFNRYETLPEFAVIRGILDGYINCEMIENFDDDVHLDVLTGTILEQLSVHIQSHLKQHHDQYSQRNLELRLRMEQLIRQTSQLQHDVNSLISDDPGISYGLGLDDYKPRNLTSEEVEQLLEAEMAEDRS